MIITFVVNPAEGDPDSTPTYAAASITSEVLNTEQEAIDWINARYASQDPAQSPDVTQWYGYVPVTFVEGPVTYN